MSDSSLGLTTAVAIALGGMVGGGIYAVLGVVAQVTGPATWAAFTLAGVVALCAAYSYNALNRLSDDHGGSVTFVEAFTGSPTAAGMVGWTLLFGYIGSMAMYGFAFAEFTVAFDAVPGTLAGLPTRPLISVAAIGAFVGLNLVGARSSGSAEIALVIGKIAILLAFGLLGVWYATGGGGPALTFGAGRLTSAGPIVAAAISFVAFQGWQLLFYDQDTIADPVETIRKSVYIAIPAALVVYVLVGVVTVALAPEALKSHPHVALKDAASRMAAPFGLGAAGATLVALSALFSTGSAINATLFSAAHFAKGMLSDDLLPDRIGDGDSDGVPPRTVLVLGAITAAFAAVGSLGAITSFASLSFIVVFGLMSVLAFRQRDEDAVNPVPPAIGAVGAGAFLPLMAWNLSQREPTTFQLVVVLSVAILVVELLYFERETVEEGVVAVEKRLAD
jgi:amino acid transporter